MSGRRRPLLDVVGTVRQNRIHVAAIPGVQPRLAERIDVARIHSSSFAETTTSGVKPYGWRQHEVPKVLPRSAENAMGLREVCEFRGFTLCVGERRLSRNGGAVGRIATPSPTRRDQRVARWTWTVHVPTRRPGSATCCVSRASATAA
jgi:hypothetical protein